jgi:hypothetical protein
MHNNILIGCSFTDPVWQQEIPWSLHFSKQYPSYISAKAGLGIKGICTEASCYLEQLQNIHTAIIILPTLWRIDIEVDEETYLCNCMVDLLTADSDGYTINQPAKRKWYISGGLHYDKKTEFAPVFDMLYKHQGNLVILKEHMRALKNLIELCKKKNIDYYISSIQDPLDQIQGLEYIQPEIYKILNSVDYQNWFKFNGVFIDKYLGHSRHPSTSEHLQLANVIAQQIFGKDLT